MSNDLVPSDNELGTLLAEGKQHVMSRLDGVAKRKHRQHLLVVAAVIAGTAVLGTAGTALVVAKPWEIRTTAHSFYELSCVQGNEAVRHPYFEVNFFYRSKKDVKLLLNPVSICREAWREVAARQVQPKPNKVPIMPLASHFLKSPTLSTVNVMSATLDDLATYTSGVPAMATCVLKDSKNSDLVVISASPADPYLGQAEWASRCQSNAGYSYEPHSGN